MVFSSIKFIFLFLPFFFISYYLVEDKYKNLCIFLYSLIFYAYGCMTNIHYVFILIASLVVNYFIGLSIYNFKKYKTFLLILAIVLNVGMLYIFKYSTLNLILPIGISFYTFQILSYVFDVYKGKITPEKKFVNLSTYIIMFPQLIAGPIVRYRDIKKDIESENRNLSIEDGIRIFVLGLSSKVIIANQLSAVGLDVNAYGLVNMTCLTAFLDAFSYTLQLYFDFFGYSLMAIGLAKCMGITIMKNFDMPYQSTSITEFWRRWHISLGKWFKDYVYIPLGGNRVGLFRTCLNLFIVFALSGIWHGSTRNYLYWGMYFGVLIIIEKLFLYKFLEKHKIIGHVYCFLAVMFSFVIFKNENIEELSIYISRMFDFKNFNENNNFMTIFTTNIKAIMIGAICITNLPKILYDKIKDIDILRIGITFILFTISIILIVEGYNDPFMYFRF